MVRAVFISLSSAMLMGYAAVAAAAEPKLDNYGDPLPAGAVLRLGTTRLQCQGGFVWMPDGTSLATAGSGRVWIWDADDGRPQKSLVFSADDHRHRLAVSADGSKLACGSSDGHLAIYDLNTGAQIFRIPAARGHKNGIEALAIAPDGSSLVTGGYSGAARLWNVATGKVKGEFETANPRNDYPSISYSLDSRRIVVGVGRTIQLFDVEHPGKPVVIDKAHDDQVLAVKFTRDGKQIISSGSGKPREVVMPGGEVVRRQPAELRVWELATLRLLKDLKAPELMESGGALALAPDDNTAVVVLRGQTLIWDLAQEKIVRTFNSRMHKYPPTLVNVAIDPTGKYLAVNGGETHLGVWDLATGRPRFAPERTHSGSVTAVCFSPDGRLVATGSADKSVRIWDITGKMLRTIERGNGWPRGLAFTKDSGHVIVAAEDYDVAGLKYFGALRSFQVSDGGLVFEQALAGRARCVALSNDSNRIAVGTGTDGPPGVAAEGPPGLYVFDADSGKKLAEFDAITAPVVAVTWSGDNSVASLALMDNTIRQVNVKTKAEISKVDAPHEYLQNGLLVPARLGLAAFPVRTASALTCTEFAPEINCWDLETGKRSWTLPAPTGAMRRIAVSADGRIVACAWISSGIPASGVSLWEIATQRELLAIDLEGQDPYSLAFSPDGRRIATGFADGTALIWDVSEAVEKLVAGK